MNYSLTLIEKTLLLEGIGKHNSARVINSFKQQPLQEFNLEEIKYVLERENIGRFQTQYVLERLVKEHEVLQLITPMYVETLIQAKIQQKPYYSGVQVNPFSKNNVHFSHKGKDYELHFMENGNIGISKRDNNKTFLEIGSDQLFDKILSKF